MRMCPIAMKGVECLRTEFVLLPIVRAAAGTAVCLTMQNICFTWNIAVLDSVSRGTGMWQNATI